MCSYFSGNLHLEEEPGEPFFLVGEDLSFKSPHLGVTVTVKKGEGTDLYSVPRPGRSIVSSLQKSSIPAVLHDHAYRKQIFGRKGRKWADKLLLSAMKCINEESIARGNGRFFSRTKMSALYTSVRLGGWVSYQRYTIS